MNLDGFKSQIERQGISRTNRWIAMVFPPSVLSTNILTSGVQNVGINLPRLDLLETFNLNLRANLDIDLSGLNVSLNASLPTKGYSISNLNTGLQSINMFCHRVNIPEINTQNVNFSEYGELRKYGHVNAYTDTTLTYYCSEDLRERTFFEEWNKLVYNHKNKNYGYYKDYVGRIEFVKYDAGWNRQTAVYRFNEAYPGMIGSAEFNYDASDLTRLDVGFKYRSYERIA